MSFYIYFIVMYKKENNYAFIDSQNINLSIRDLGWKIDWRKFRIYLKEHYSVTNAFMFIGYIEKYQNLYDSLEKSGFIIIFKPVTKDSGGRIKGNIDAELVLHTLIRIKYFDKAVIVTSDGDFHCLVEYLIKISKFKKLLVPNYNKTSSLLRKFKGKIATIENLKENLQIIKHKRERPQ